MLVDEVDRHFAFLYFILAPGEEFGNGFSLGIRSQGSDHFAIAFPVVRRKAAFSGDGKLRACQRFFGQCVGFYDLYLELNRLIGSLQFCGLV